MKYRSLASLTLLALPLATQAIEPGPSSPYQAHTEHWLNLQVSGQIASPTPQSATATERESALRRLLESTHPIPEFYEAQGEGSNRGSSK